MRKNILNSSQTIPSINFGNTTSLIQTGNVISFRIIRPTKGVNKSENNTIKIKCE